MSPSLPGEGNIMVEARHPGVIAINGVSVVLQIKGIKGDQGVRALEFRDLCRAEVTKIQGL